MLAQLSLAKKEDTCVDKKKLNQLKGIDPKCYQHFTKSVNRFLIKICARNDWHLSGNISLNEIANIWRQSKILNIPV